MSGVELADAISGLIAIGLIFMFIIMVIAYVSGSIEDDNRRKKEREIEANKKATNDDGWLNLNFDDVSLPAYNKDKSDAKQIIVADVVEID